MSPPAFVRPRVLELPKGRVPLLLDDALAPYLERGVEGVIMITGSPGSGKTTAAHYLRARIGDQPEVAVLEGAQALQSHESALCIVLLNPDEVPEPEPKSHADLAHFCLAPWTRDDVLDYLLARFPERCGSVLERIDHERWNQRLEGRPLLWSAVLDVLAHDEQCRRIDQALRRSFEARGLPKERRSHALRYCMRQALPEMRRRPHASPEPPRLCRHRAAQVAIGVKPILEDLGSNIMKQFWPRDLIEAAVPLLEKDAAILNRLRGVLRSSDRPQHRTAATLLHAAAPGRLREVLEESSRSGRKPLLLANAQLEGASWSGLSLRGLDLRRALLERASFADTDLSEANLESSVLSRTRFERARLDRADLCCADLHRSTLERTSALGASFRGANLCRIQLLRTRLDMSDLSDCDLGSATAVRASFRRARLHEVAIDGASFDGVHFGGADLQGLALDTASFRACLFTEANLASARLEGMFLRQVRFEAANLQRALLTGSHFQGGDMRGCDLRHAGLAEIDWRNVDLRGARFAQASFQLGSTRSGRLDLGVSYGTRTGFYTDDYCDQNYRRPEEIRKANLAGCDLRGAQVEGADFYLVDLRSAHYTADQARHFQRCGAIMDGTGGH